MNAAVLLVFGLLMTFVLETIVFIPLFLKKDGYFIGAFYCVNAATNLSLNVLLAGAVWLMEEVGVYIFSDGPAAYLLGCCTVLLEIAIVFIEYAVLKKFQPYKNLLVYVAGANALSAVAGSLFMAFFIASF